MGWTTLGLFLVLGLIQLTTCDLYQASDEKIKVQRSKLDPSEPEAIKGSLRDALSMKADADHDGYVSYQELRNYIADLLERRMEFNLDRQWREYSPQIHEVFSWEGYEPERREVLTWDSYFNQTYPDLMGIDIGIPINREQDSARMLNKKDETKGTKTIEEKEKIEVDQHLKDLKLMAERADARWKLADENGDTLLTKQEFKFLQYPDQGCEELKNLFLREVTEDMDENSDGSVSLPEFMTHMKTLATEEEKEDRGWMANQQENFGRFLDKNKDGILDQEEMRSWLMPSKEEKVETEAKRIFEAGDLNDDHRLAMGEILDYYEHYLSLLPPEHWYPEDALESKHIHYEQDDEVVHDEL